MWRSTCLAAIGLLCFVVPQVANSFELRSTCAYGFENISTHFLTFQRNLIAKSRHYPFTRAQQMRCHGDHCDVPVEAAFCVAIPPRTIDDLWTTICEPLGMPPGYQFQAYYVSCEEQRTNAVCVYKDSCILEYELGPSDEVHASRKLLPLVLLVTCSLLILSLVGCIRLLRSFFPERHTQYRYHVQPPPYDAPHYSFTPPTNKVSVLS